MKLVSRLNRWATGKLNKDIPEDRQFALDIADIILDLEGRIEHEYRDTLMYPGQRRRYERDRAVIVRVKRALGLTA